jgi:hypothetical protein
MVNISGRMGLVGMCWQVAASVYTLCSGTVSRRGVAWTREQVKAGGSK